MNADNLAHPTQPTILEQIHKDMRVHDQKGDDIGKVEVVYFGEDAGHVQQYGVGSPTVRDPAGAAAPLANFVRNLFNDDIMPEPLRERLLKEGFIRVDAPGLFARDRYVLRDQIASVSGDIVHLNVTRDELIKR